MIRRASLLVAVALGSAACTDPPPDRWHVLYASVIAVNCTTSACHSSLGHAGGVALFSDDEAFLALTGRRCEDDATPAAGYVDVEAPAESFLSILLRRSGPTGMPPNTRLADVEIDWLEAWMARGAPCD